MIKQKKTFEIKIFERTPMFMCALFLILGIIISANLFIYPSNQISADVYLPTIFLLVMLVVILFIGFIMYGYKKSIGLLMCIFMSFFGYAYAQVTLEKSYKPNDIIVHESFNGRIISMHDSSEKSISLTVDNILLQGNKKKQQINGKISLTIFGQSSSYLESEYYLLNSVINVKASLEYPAVNQQYGFFNERNNLLAQNIAYKAATHYGAVEIIEKNKPYILKGIVNSFRQTLFNRLDRYVGDDESELMKALLTGQKDNLTYDIKSSFSTLGISHLLATSGLHIGILLLAFEYLAKKLRIPIVYKILMSFILLFMFMLLAGFRISMVRAAIMWAMLMAARLWGSKYNGINALGVAIFIMIMINPLCIYDISFVLSCMSVGAIAFFYSPINNLFKKVKKTRVIGIVSVTSAVILFTWPIIAYYFNSVSLLSPIFNIIFIPLMSLLLIISFLFSMLSGISFLIPLLAAIAKALSFVIIFIAKMLVPYSASLSIISPPMIAILMWILGMVILSKNVILIKNNIRIYIAAPLLLCSIIIVFISQYQTSHNMQLKTFSDNSVTVLYLQDKNKNAMILNDDCYISKSVLQKTALKKLDIIIYSGNDSKTLERILMDLSPYKINNIYAHKSIAKKIDNYNIMPVDEVNFGEYVIDLFEFKATSKDAKIHYAARITQGNDTLIYLDPLSLRKEAFEDIIISDIICSRWSKSRAKNIENFNFSRLHINDAAVNNYQIITSLEQKSGKIYNNNYSGAINIKLSEGKNK